VNPTSPSHSIARSNGSGLCRGRHHMKLVEGVSAGCSCCCSSPQLRTPLHFPPSPSFTRPARRSVPMITGSGRCGATREFASPALSISRWCGVMARSNTQAAAAGLASRRGSPARRDGMEGCAIERADGRDPAVSVVCRHTDMGTQHAAGGQRRHPQRPASRMFTPARAHDDLPERLSWCSGPGAVRRRGCEAARRTAAIARASRSGHQRALLLEKAQLPPAVRAAAEQNHRSSRTIELPAAGARHTNLRSCRPI